MRSASRTISAASSQTMTSPKSAHALPAMSAVGRIVNNRSTSFMVSRASISELVIRTAGEVGPCSAWPSKSVAQISPSTVSSAMISVSVGPASEIDANAAEQLALGFGYISIARSNDHIDGMNSLGAKRHRCDRLHAAKHKNLVCAAKMHRRDDSRVRAALEWRRASNDVLHAGNTRGDDRHMRRSDHWIAPPGT